MKEKTIALVDGNNFFANCEILINPSLTGKPVCVLSNNNGCVIARSNEAKKLGIPMGIPYFMAKKDFKNVIYLSANFSLYHDLSERMMNLLTRYSDKIEQYSIDEAFIDVSGCDKIFNMNFKELAVKIRQDIAKEIGLSVSVGIANSKVLAKIATHKAKSRNGTYIIAKHLIREELQNLPVNEIWGVGKNIARSLRKFGIFYADEILLKDDNFFKFNYGKKGMELKYELMGNSVIPLTGKIEKPKSLQRSRAFPVFSKDKEYIKTELNFHLHNICKKLRENNLEAEIISVMLRTKDFRVFYREERLETATDSELQLINTVNKLFGKLYNPEIIYRASGIGVSSLKDISSQIQLTFIEDNKEKKNRKLACLIDKIENKYGQGIISAGVTGIKSSAKNHNRITRAAQNLSEKISR